MSGNKKSFILYLDQQDLFNTLPDEQAGKLIKHIFSYVNCENPVTEYLLIDVAFASIKQALKRDLEKWEAQIKQRSDAGKISAEKRAAKANEKQRKPTKRTTVKSRATKSTDSVNDSVSVSGSDKPKEVVAQKDTSLAIGSFPTKDKLFHVYQEDFDEWQGLYPKVDIKQSMNGMFGWLKANPAKQKTSKGMPRFINSWLSRAQDDADKSPPSNNISIHDHSDKSWAKGL